MLQRMLSARTGGVRAAGGGGGASEPFDLTLGGQYTIPFAYNWPDPPATTTPVSVTADSIASLQDAVITDGALVSVPAGVYTGPLVFGNDVRVVCASGVTWRPNSDLTLTAGQRVRWDNGIIDGQAFGDGLSLFNRYDFLFNNVYFNDMRGLYTFLGTEGARIALVSCTGTFTNYASFSQGAFTGTRTNFADFIAANCDFSGGFPLGAEATFRIMRMSRALMVGNRLWNGAKHSFRTHYGSEDMWFVQNQLEGGSMEAHYTEGNGAPTARPENVLGAHYIMDNTYYNPNSGAVNVQRGPNSVADFDGPVIVTGNTAYHVDQTDPSGEADRRFPSPVNAGDITSGNIEYPFEAPPAFGGGAVL